MLLFGAVESVVSVISFAAILWNLSGPLTLLGFTLPKAMFLIVFVYVLIATVVAFWIGRPLIRLSFRNELFNAAFRYALVRLRDAAEAVGFYRGERAERVQLSRHFDDTIANYRRYVARTLGFTGWNTTIGQVINPLPWIVQAPRLFANEITFGDVNQSSAAFGSIFRRVVVLPQRLRPVRRLSGGDHPPARPGGRQREGPRPADAGHRALHR